MSGQKPPHEPGEQARRQREQLRHLAERAGHHGIRSADAAGRTVMKHLAARNGKKKR